MTKVVCPCPPPVIIPRLIITPNTVAMRYSTLVQIRNSGCIGGPTTVSNTNITAPAPPRNRF